MALTGPSYVGRFAPLKLLPLSSDLQGQRAHADRLRACAWRSSSKSEQPSHVAAFRTSLINSHRPARRLHQHGPATVTAERLKHARLRATSVFLSKALHVHFVYSV
eukprot:4233490-Pleurochrysis_carterae.AAC.3